MTMIKLKLTLHDGEQMKMMVDLNPHQQLTVLDFLKRAVDICCMSQHPDDLEMYDGEYLLPHLLPARYIQQGKIYKVIVGKSKKSKINQKKKQKVAAAQVNKKKTIARKGVKSSSSSSSSDSSSKSSSSSALKQFNEKNKTKKIKLDKISHIQQNKKIRVLKMINSNPVQDHKIQHINKVNPGKHKQHQASSQQSESSITPAIQKVSQKKIEIKQSIEKINKVEKVKPIKAVSSSSQQQVDQPQKYKQKVAQILTEIKSNQRPAIASKAVVNAQRPQNQKNVKPATNLNVPISVRKKQVQPNPTPSANSSPIQAKPATSFKQHQEMKWIPVTKPLLMEWLKSQTDPIVANGNQLRFKIVELDEERFIPVESGWITGYVTQIQNKDKMVTIRFQSVTKNNRQETGAPEFMKSFQIPLHNMQQLQLNRNTLNEKQNKAIQQANVKPVVEQKLIENKSNVSVTITDKPKQIDVKQKVNDIKQKQQGEKANQSVEQYVCGQINYYFGPKNYPSDLFMQMHANNNPQGNINLRLMLNFPKIKKVLTDQEKLWKFLTEDSRYSSRNYELDFQKKMIRRKQ